MMPLLKGDFSLTDVTYFRMIAIKSGVSNGCIAASTLNKHGTTAHVTNILRDKSMG
jgi:hypothetical protein